MIEVRGLAIDLGAFHLRDVDLHVREGEFCVLLGPTGAGKTVLVECIAGLQRPTAGSVRLAGRDVTGWPPERREVAYVPQDYCLFPHLTVRENIAFGLRLRGVDGPGRAQRIADLASLLQVEPLLDRHPLTLSGGEKQRVALARALAIRPRLLLLDEPLAALDARTREQVADELKAVQRESGTTTIHVSHDLEETWALADQVAVLVDGRLLQAGTPREVFDRPSTRALAEFVGSGNLLEGRVEEGPAGPRFVRGGLELAVPGGRSGRWILVVRPEALRVDPTPPPGGGETWPGTVEHVSDRGATVRLLVAAAGATWSALLSPREAAALPIEPGARVWIRVPPEARHLVPP